MIDLHAYATILRALALALASTTVACRSPTDDDDPNSARSICDGSEDVRFVGKWLPGGQIGFSELFRSELGLTYLYINGRCEYWVLKRPVGALDRVHTGTISSADSAELEQSFTYGNFSEVAGLYTDSATSDGSTALFFDGVDTIACYASCEDAPESVGVARDSLTPWIESLWDKGVEHDGGVRLVANRIDRFDTVEWPLDWGLATVEYQPGVPPGERTYEIGNSTLVSSVQDAAKLRTLWDGAPAPDAADYELHVRDTAHDNGTFDLWLRDALPFEDAAGLFFVPTPCGADYDCVAAAVCVDFWCAKP